jgi:myo-inositol-1(or 4)-monophosphatase
MTSPREILSYLLPFVVSAGKYSAAIQQGVNTHQAKEGTTLFHQALSDADISIQSFIEVALLAKFPQVSFFSEEQAASLNARYFPLGADYEVLLDPVDGTRAYIDNRSTYQVIVTVHDSQAICGALAYMPRRGEALMAIRGEGATRLTDSEIAQGSLGRALRVSQNEGPVLVFNRPDIVARLRAHVDVRDLAQEYERGEQGHTSMDLLRDRANAVILAPSQAIDGGALAFIAQEAGATVTDATGAAVGSYRGNAQRVLPCVIVGVNPTWHQKVLELMRDEER